MNILDKRSRTQPNQPFLINPEQDVIYDFEQTKQLVNRRILELKEEGLKTGKKAGIMMAPGSTFVINFLASIKLGLHLFPLPRDANENVLKNKIKRANSYYLISKKINSQNKNRGSISDVKVIDAEPSQETKNLSNPEIEDHSHRFKLIIYTSGSTGKSKGVILNWENLRSSARASKKRLGKNDNDLWFSPLPVHHIGGISPVVRSLLNGTRLIMDQYSTSSILKTFQRYSITGISLVPTMLRDLLEYSQNWKYSELRFALLGGAKTPPQLRKRAYENNIPLFPTYGMTETSSQIATASPEESINFPDTVGRPLSNIQVSIVDQQNNDLGSNTEGEIVVDGSAVAEGYFQNQQLNSQFFDSIGFHTQDIGYRDEKGRLYVTDRVGRKILKGGESVDPVEIENLISSLEDIQESAVFPIPDERLGQIVIVCVIPKTPERFSKNSLNSKLKTSLEPHKIPDEILVKSELPRTATGTVDRNRLRKSFQNE